MFELFLCVDKPRYDFPIASVEENTQSRLSPLGSQFLRSFLISSGTTVTRQEDLSGTEYAVLLWFPGVGPNPDPFNGVDPHSTVGGSVSGGQLILGVRFPGVPQNPKLDQN